MKSTLVNAGIALIAAAFSVSCVRPAESPDPASSKMTNKRVAPDSGNADGAPSQDESSSDDQLVGLLQEQNKRLKAQVQRLEKENAELKARLPDKQ